MEKWRARQGCGFTLIELLIAVVVLAILLSIALPAYYTYVRRANRNNAAAALLKAAQWMERVATAQGRYPAQLAVGLEAVEGGAYSVCLLGASVAPGVTLPAPGCPAGVMEWPAAPVFTVSWWLAAYPRQSGPNATDPCGALAVNNIGQRWVILPTNSSLSLHDGVTLSTCWNK